MAADDTIVYDYDAIDDCLDLMQKRATEVQERADELAADVKGILGEWTGSTSERYDSTANDLKRDLIDAQGRLTNLRANLQAAAEAMAHADASGAKNV
jgi:WXG100 family type VII secretion target